jgi:hypothetical protein
MLSQENLDGTIGMHDYISIENPEGEKQTAIDGRKDSTVVYTPIAKTTSNNSRCHEASTAYVCAVTSHNYRRNDAGGFSCRSAPRLYDSTDSVLLSECVQCS